MQPESLTGRAAAGMVRALMRTAKTIYTPMRLATVNVVLRNRGAFWHDASKQEEFI